MRRHLHQPGCDLHAWAQDARVMAEPRPCSADGRRPVLALTGGLTGGEHG